uniref:Non-specific phospholipase C6 n=1 Tax=Cannabis sativa TaxID=3483 RepID=A0A803P833_CANSA
MGGSITRPRNPSFSFIFLLFLTLSWTFQTTLLVIGAPQSKQPIKTVVVLVMENRSFDHMLGWMKKAINPVINGVNGDECNPVSTKNPKPETICFTDDAEFVDPDPGHSFEAVEQQVFGSSSFPSMSGFVEQALSMSPNLSETVMKGFRPGSVPVYASLVSEFAVFDRWFSSIPGPTQPNRLLCTLLLLMAQRVMLKAISTRNIPTTLFYRNMRKLKYIFKFHQFDLKFKKDARNGKLPSLTVIEPRASPQWNQTLLVITYDEHGGFFDHVKTPYVNVPNPDGNTGPAPYFFKFDRLGVRVPTIMVSPWIKKGIVVSGPKGPTPNSEFEHSSIPATIKKIFNLSSNFLTHRDAWAGTFEHVFGELTSPRTDCPVTLPEVTPLRTTEAKENSGLSEFQSEVVQLAAVLNGDHFLSSFPDEMGKKMSVKEAHEYVKGAVSRFIRASKEAIKLGADESAIVDMRSSLTTRSSIHN